MDSFLTNYLGQRVDLSNIPPGHHVQIDYCDPDVGEYAVFQLNSGDHAANNRRALLILLDQDEQIEVARALLLSLAERLVEVVPDENGSIDFYLADSWASLGRNRSEPMEYVDSNDPATLLDEMMCRLRAMTFRDGESTDA